VNIYAVDVYTLASIGLIASLVGLFAIAMWWVRRP
jgi:hypothetical protein